MDYYEQYEVWRPIEVEAEQEIVRKCGICNKVISGYIWKRQVPIDLSLQFRGIICNKCGYTFCYSNKTFIHKKELKPYGISRFKRGSCPGCGTSFKNESDSRFIVWHQGRFFSEDGRCMTCGIKRELMDIAIWSGVIIGETNNNRGMGLLDVVFKPVAQGLGLADNPHSGRKDLTKVIRTDLKVCAECSETHIPEKCVYAHRLTKQEITQDECPLFDRVPFE